VSDIDPVEAVLDALHDAGRNSRSDWRWPVLATVDETGRPRTRILVVRHFDDAAREIELHTDARSAKVRELAHNPDCSLLFFARTPMMQIRIEGRARVHRTGPVAEAAWARAPSGSVDNYAGDPPPGMAVSGPDAVERDPGPDNCAARAHFAAIRIAAGGADWLKIERERHLRARIDFTAEPPRCVWTAP